MTNNETIEKLNEALTQLIDAYKILQDKNDNLEIDVKNKNETINDLETRFSELNGNTEVQSTKMDGMLSRIQSLLTPSTIESNNEKELVNEVQKDKENITANESILDLDLNIEEEDKKEDSNKIDLGRMESLLNGLNTK